MFPNTALPARSPPPPPRGGAKAAPPQDTGAARAAGSGTEASGAASCGLPRIALHLAPVAPGIASAGRCRDGIGSGGAGPARVTAPPPAGLHRGPTPPATPTDRGVSAAGGRAARLVRHSREAPRRGRHLNPRRPLGVRQWSFVPRCWRAWIVVAAAAAAG